MTSGASAYPARPAAGVQSRHPARQHQCVDAKNAVIGLRRHSVRLAAHDPVWERLGREACARIGNACEDLQVRVEHVGSTSVPGLSAKPIIDIVAGLPDADAMARLEARLTEIGFIYRGEGEGSVGHLFVWESEPDVRTVHVHAVPHGSAYWKEYVCFRDALRQDPDLRRRYEQLKRNNAATFSNDRKAYTAAKDSFVRDVLRTRAGLSWDDEGPA